MSLFFIGIFSFLIQTVALAEEPKFQCAVNSKNGKELREANASEAAKQAADIWRKNSKNSSASIFWISPFVQCMQASGLPIENYVYDRKDFQKSVISLLAKRAKEIREEKNPKIKVKQFSEFEESKNKLKLVFPDFDSSKPTLQFKAEEIQEFENQKVEFEEKEKSDCTDINMAALLGPVRDQTDKGWCYAFSAAELVTFRLGPETNKFNRRVSAADIAFQFNHENTSWFSKVFRGSDIGETEGGWMNLALKAALKNQGFCLEKNAPSEGFAFGKLDQTIEDIRSIVEAQNPSADHFCFSYLRVQDMFPGIDLDSYGKILFAAGNDNWEYFKQLNRQNCEGKRNNYDISTDAIVNLKRESDGQDSMASAIDYQLSKKNILSIAFNAQMMGREYYGGHAVNIVGRKYDEKEKTCKYLLRNSWGNGCSSKIYSHLCAKEYPGHLWVSKERLMKYTFDVTYIKP
jgi:hypothetical protein